MNHVIKTAAAAVVAVCGLAVIGCGSQPSQITSGQDSVPTRTPSQQLSQPPSNQQPSQPVVSQSCHVWRKMTQELPGDYARKYTATLVNNSGQQVTVNDLTVDLTGADGSVLATVDNNYPGGGADGMILPPGAKGRASAGFDSTDISAGSGNSADVTGCAVVNLYVQNPADPSESDVQVTPAG